MVNERQKINDMQNKVRGSYGTCKIWTKMLCVMSTIALCLTGCAGEVVIDVMPSEAEEY